MATRALEGKRKVRDALVAAMAGQPVQVTYSNVRDPQVNWAFVGKVTYDDSVWAAIGAHKRYESFSVHVIFNVKGNGLTPELTESRALGYVDLFETALRADPSLGGLTVSGVALIPTQFNSQPLADGAECQWEGVVKITNVRI